jgi:hypothetical protein
LTVTWSADLTHFSLLHQSLASSPLASLPHFVVVQSEDLDAFKTFAGRHTILHSSAEVLRAMWKGSVKMRAIGKHD